MKSGDKCERCSVGRLLTYRTITTKDKQHRTRYLKCCECGATAKEILTAVYQSGKSITSATIHQQGN